MATSSTQSVQFSNIGTGATAQFAIKGGKYSASSSATFGGGNQQLQILALDAVTWINVGSSITAAGLTTYDLPPGQYRWNITTATANYIALTTVPGES
jgi:hypothetical protein